MITAVLRKRPRRCIFLSSDATSARPESMSRMDAAQMRAKTIREYENPRYRNAALMRISIPPVSQRTMAISSSDRLTRRRGRYTLLARNRRSQITTITAEPAR